MTRAAVLVAATIAVGALGYGVAQATNSGGGDVVAAGDSPPAILSAVVDARGDLVRGTGATSADQRRLGSYEVIFNQNVRSCAYVATIGGVGIGIAATGQIDTYSSTATPRGVVVGTANSAGQPGNRPFHLIVRC